MRTDKGLENSFYKDLGPYGCHDQVASDRDFVGDAGRKITAEVTGIS